ncbi:hypothetical protein [Lacinutrix sp. MEBiC02404]
MGQNNPIQERVDQMLLKWTLAINTPKVKIVRVLAAEDEQDMLGAYYQYMLAVDSNQQDFVLILTSPFTSAAAYSNDLLQELEEEINNWNTAEIPDAIPFETITWKPDYSLGNPENPAQLLIKNLNSFANYLQPEKKVKISIVLLIQSISEKNATDYFNAVLETDMESHLIIGIDDTRENPIYNSLAENYPEEVYTIEPDFNIDAAIEQMAALGDPTATETPYRANLAKLINGVKERDEKKVQHAAKNCLDIATKALKKDANWLMQIVTVYTILYNDQLGYKNYDDALYFSNKAVETALISKDLLKPEMAYRLIGQTHLGRGALHQLKKNKNQSVKDYDLAAKAYATAKDYLMQCESLRLAGYMAKKSSLNDESTQYYLQAYYLKDALGADLARSSTYPLVVQQLLKDYSRNQFLSDNQMNQDMSPLFGEQWEETIEEFGKLSKKIKQ